MSTVLASGTGHVQRLTHERANAKFPSDSRSSEYTLSQHVASQVRPGGCSVVAVNIAAPGAVVPLRARLVAIPSFARRRHGIAGEASPGPAASTGDAAGEGDAVLEEHDEGGRTQPA